MVSCYTCYITNKDIQVYLRVAWQCFDILVVLVYNILTRGGGGGGGGGGGLRCSARLHHWRGNKCILGTSQQRC